MKEFIGSKIQVTLDGGMKFIGKVVSDNNYILCLQGNDEKIYRINKSKIVIFCPETEPTTASNTTKVEVLACANPTMPCPGVRFVKVGGVKETDFDLFMNACPLKCSTCIHKRLGRIEEIPQKLLINEFDSLMIGEYPKKKEK